MRRRGGFVLATALLLLLALASLGGGALLLARRELEIAMASATLLQERLAAEVAVRRAVEVLAEDTLPRLPTWRVARVASGTAGRAEWEAEVVGLRPELVMLRGSAWTPSGGRRPPPRVAALVAWGLDPATRLGALGATVEVGGTASLEEGAVDGWTVASNPEGWPPRLCAPWRSVVDSLFPGGVLPTVTPLVDTTGVGFPSLGALDADGLLERFPVRAAGTLTPAPVVVLGRCATGTAGNWGSPKDPGGPCGGHRPLVAATGDLTLEGGEGQGVLLVTGDLRLAGGAHYAGLLLVGGDLVVEGGADLLGAARVGGRLLLERGGQIAASACPVLLALAQAVPLRAPVVPRHGPWLGPF